MKRNFSLLMLAVVAVLAMVSCGGSGSSNNSSPYTGVRTAAVITQQNADNIVEQAYQGTDAASSFNLLLSPSTEGVPSTTEANNAATAIRPKLLSLAKLFKNATGSALAQQSQTNRSPRAVVTESGTEYPPGGGSFTYTLSLDDQTGVFSGSLVFNNCRGDFGEFISGTINVSGVYDINTDVFENINISTTGITISDGYVSLSGSGSVIIVVNNPATITFDFYIRNNTTGKTVWVENFIINMTEGIGFIEITVSGKIYLHDYGWVIVSTPTPFHFISGNFTPSSGIMIFTGSSNSKAKLTVIDTSTYSVSVDGNGDGAYENSWTHPWI